MGQNKVKVLYIAGAGRSGSTVLGRLLGHAEGFVPLGELNGVWTRGIVQNELCSCGSRFRECPMWRAVFQEAYSGFDTLHAIGSIEHGHPLVRKSDMLALVLPGTSRRQQQRLATVADHLESLYRALANVTGSRGIVDSSKPPGYALMLSAVPGIELHVLHLVRDSRAVVYSWLRKKVKYERDGETVYMRPRTPFMATREWIRTNTLSELLLKRRGGKYFFARYEDFAANPRATIDRIGTFLGEDLSTLPFVDDRTVELSDEHFSFGNPMQFQRGRIALREDEEWRSKMEPGDRRLVTALTWPLLLRYGYVGRAEAGPVTAGAAIPGRS